MICFKPTPSSKPIMHVFFLSVLNLCDLANFLVQKQLGVLVLVKSIVVFNHGKNETHLSKTTFVSRLFRSLSATTVKSKWVARHPKVSLHPFSRKSMEKESEPLSMKPTNLIKTGEWRFSRIYRVCFGLVTGFRASTHKASCHALFIVEVHLPINFKLVHRHPTFNNLRET